MERRLKERLIGAAVLVMLAVIFIPMILSDSNRTETAITKTNIPKPPEGEVTSHIAPVQESELKSAGADEAAAPAQPQEQKPAPAPAAKAAPGPEASKAPAAKAAPKSQASKAPAAKAAPESQASKTPAASTAPVAKVSPEPVAKTGSTAAAPTPAAASGQHRELISWVVQIGSFSSHDNADRLLKKLQGSGYAAFIEPIKQGSETVYRVRVGPEVRRSSAESLKDKLARELKMKGLLVLEYP